MKAAAATENAAGKGVQLERSESAIAAEMLRVELQAVSFTTPEGEEVVGSLAGPFRHSAEIRNWRGHPLYGKAVSAGVRSVFVIITTVISMASLFESPPCGHSGSYYGACAPTPTAYSWMSWRMLRRSCILPANPKP